MNIGRQIHSLLKKHHAVFVKGLGTFKRIHTPASYDEKRSVMLPPISFIEFDKDIQDGYDFTSYIQQVNQYGVLEAETELENWINKLTNEINQNGQASLDDLGYLVKYGNSFVFKAIDLSGFQYAPLDDPYFKTSNEISEVVPPAITENEVIAESEESVEEAENELVSDANETEEIKEEVIVDVNQHVSSPTHTFPPHRPYEYEERKSKSGVFVWIAIFALLVLGGLYYYNTYYMNNTNQIFEEFVEDTNLIDTVDTVPTLDTTSLSPIDTTSIKDTLSTVSQPEVKPEVQENKDYKYTIIIGTHKNLAQAYDEAEAYNKDGHRTVRVLTPNLAKNLKRVVWDTYPTRELRDSALRYVRKHIKADAWGTELN